MNSIIKLTSGETLIAEIVHEDEKITSILEPLLLEIGESDSGRPMMIALSWIPLTKKVNMVNLKSQHIIAVADCDEEISAYYAKSLAVFKGDYPQGTVIEDDEILDSEQAEIIDLFSTANTVH